jgi:hypothetical protein
MWEISCLSGKSLVSRIALLHGIGFLVDWLVGWLISWLVDWLFDWLACELFKDSNT